MPSEEQIQKYARGHGISIAEARKRIFGHIQKIRKGEMANQIFPDDGVEYDLIEYSEVDYK